MLLYSDRELNKYKLLLSNGFTNNLVSPAKRKYNIGTVFSLRYLLWCYKQESYWTESIEVCVDNVFLRLFRIMRIVTVAEARGQFVKLKGEKRPPLESAAKQRSENCD
jgi:hypothetical protein